ncbi:hypothetical protein [Mesorhizobium sp. AR02]|uniref:hypothetical protein n=1 Tax=Mesorhizobium sp. AR02 TaxID=2865837 RepID=UPI00215E060F|nr:hypothetical protein [Mesorhizobium sp. AR02]
MSLDVGTALLLQFKEVNQSLLAAPVHVSSALAEVIDSPAMAVPASSSAASPALRCIGRNVAREEIMIGNFQKDFREKRALKRRLSRERPCPAPPRS